MDILVARMPDAVFVIQEIVMHPAGGSGAPKIRQVLDPGALKAGIRREIRVVGIIPRDGRAVARSDAIAGVGEPL